MRTRQKLYSIYDRSTTDVILSAFLFLTIAVLTLSGFFLNRFLLEDFDPLIFPLLLVFIVPYTYTILIAVRSGYLLRLLLRFRVDDTGLHCMGLGWKPFTISWDAIRTYAVFYRTDPRFTRTLMMFSTNKGELAPPDYVTANAVSSGRIIMEYRDDVWKVLKAHMPQDMVKKMSDALERDRSCFHKR